MRYFYLLNMTKLALRKKYLKIRDRLEELEVLEKSGQICRKVLSLDVLAGARTISSYFAFRNEVDTKELINSLVKSGQKVVIAQFMNNAWRFAQFNSWTDLEEGPYGILQPKTQEVTSANSIDVAILPGVVFDQKGVRLGYGKGVFDKLLAKSPALRIGLAFDFQVVDELPREKHDLVMDFVVTEKRILSH